MTRPEGLERGACCYDSRSIYCELAVSSSLALRCVG
jgi:hypothetical protein